MLGPFQVLPCRSVVQVAESTNSPEMSRRERPARAGLQVALEAGRRGFIRKFDRDDQTPRPMLERVTRGSGIVPLETLVGIRCAADVVA